jgi:PAS domain S-box-containing protein
VALKGTCFYRDAAAERFPADPLLARIGAQSYLGTALRGPAGQVLGVVAVAHDRALDEALDPLGLLEVFAGRIAAEMQRRRTDEALRESRERFRLLVQAVEGHVLVTTDAQGLLTSWNVGAERLFGWRSEEVLGRDAATLVAPDGPSPDWVAKAREQAAVGDTAAREGVGLKKDGRRFALEATFSALRDEQGRLHGYALLARSRG